MTARRPSAQPSAGAGASILIVEDEGTTAQDLRRALTDLGYRVVGPAASASAAIDLVTKERPHLALVDIRLAGPIDGIGLAAELRHKHSVPVVCLTAQSDRETVDHLKTAAPHGCLITPFDAGQLRVAVELALHNAAIERATRQELSGERAKVHELETRTELLEDRLQEIAGLVSDPTGETPAVGFGLQNRFRGLSRREVEIVRLLAEGRRVAAIARDLDLSVHTVRNHLRAIFRKLELHSQEELLDAVRGAPPGPTASE